MGAVALTARLTRELNARVAVLTVAGWTLAACATAPLATVGTGGQPSPKYNGYKVGQPYQVRGVWYYPKEQPNYDEIGIASWYGDQFHNQYTADGEVFDMTLPSAAHKTLPMPSLVEVTNLTNGKKLVVRVNDRGPFVDGRIIDLSKEAAAELGFVTAGITKVRVRYIGQAADPPGYEPRQEIASARKAPKAVRRPVELAVAAPAKPVPYSQLAATPPAPPMPAPSLPRAQVAPSRATPMLQEPEAAEPAPPSAKLADVDALLADRTLSASTPRATYELQAGAFQTEEAARRFASGLTGGGLPEVQAVRDGGQLGYRVVVHGLATPVEAAQAKSEAMALGAPHIAIVSGS